MGCSACHGEPKMTSNEIKVEQPPNSFLENKIPRPRKATILDNLFDILNKNSFTEYEFKKFTRHSLIFEGNFRQWKTQSQKLVTIQGLVSPNNIEQLKLANIQLKELKSSTIASSSTIQIDPNMRFQCALKIGEHFPQLKLNFLREEKQFLDFKKGQFTIIRSWNLFEQMLNFERMIDYVNLLSEKNPNFDYRLIGIIRGNEDQTNSYEQAIDYNQWKQFRQICLIFQDGLDNDGFILDVDYDQVTNTIEKDNILSCCLIDDEGRIVWKRYENELSFASDVDEVEEELDKYIVKQQIPPKFPQRINQLQTAISPQNYQQLKKLIKEEIFSKCKQFKFTRQLIFQISKEVYYKNSQKIGVSFRPHQIQIHSSNISLDFIQQLYSQIKSKLSEELGDEIKIINWDKKLLINQMRTIFTENDLKLQVQLEKATKIIVNKQQIIILNTPWEQGNFIPTYQETSYIQYMKQWLLTRDILLPKLQLETTKQKSQVELRISEICFNFFRQLPGVSSSLSKKFGKIPYVERRSPPFEDLPQSTSIGLDQISRQENHILLVYLIDYENEDSINILKEFINEKEQKQQLKQVQIVVLGHIRAESWTKLFQAFIEYHKLQDKIQKEIIETWFPIEDKISSLSFLGILGKIYGMQLEKKDIMIVDKSDKIVYLNSSRRLKGNFNETLLQIDQQKLVVNAQQTQYFIFIDMFLQRTDYQTQWQKFKKFIRQSEDLEQKCKEIQAFLKDDDDLIHIEQKQFKIWDFQNSQDTPPEKKLYNQPTLKIKGTEELKKQANTKLLQSVYNFVSQTDFETR